MTAGARITAALVLGLALPAAAETVTGTATYRERMLLPPGAVLEVTVEDISRAGAASEVLGRTVLMLEGGPPYAFEIAVDPAAIDPRARLSVRAGIRHDGALLFTTDTVAPVLTQDAGTRVDLLLVRVAGTAAPLIGTDWRLTELGGAPLPAEAREPVLRFERDAHGASFAASAGCNRFAGTANIGDETLSFGPARATRMACPPPLDAAEAALSAALASTVRFETDAHTLRLLDAQGSVLLEAAAP